MRRVFWNSAPEATPDSAVNAAKARRTQQVNIDHFKGGRALQVQPEASIASSLTLPEGPGFSSFDVPFGSQYPVLWAFRLLINYTYVDTSSSLLTCT